MDNPGNYNDIEIRDSSVNYGKYSLSHNPFPLMAITTGGTHFPLYEAQGKEIIDDFILRTYLENQYGGMIVVGDYGFGKTYTLRYIEKEINEKYSNKDAGPAVAIYIENPQSNARELISTVVTRFGLNKYFTLLWGLVTKAFRSSFEHQGSNFIDQFKNIDIGMFDRDLVLELFHEERIQNPMRLLKRICDELTATGQFKLDTFSKYAYDNVISKIFGHTELAKALSQFNKAGLNASIRDWTYVIEKKSLSKSFHVGSSEVAYLKSILDVFKRNGFQRVYLLIDEFEDIDDTMRKDKMTDYLETLRDCIDQNQDMLAVVIAFKPSVIERIEEVYSGFLQRFQSSYQIDLAGIMVKAIERFVSDILKSSRLGDVTGDDMDIEPFTNDGIERIYHYTGPNPRLILQSCSNLLYELAKIGGNSIDMSFVDNFYTYGRATESISLKDVWITKGVNKQLQKKD